VVERYIWISDTDILDPAEYGLENFPQVYQSPEMAEEVGEQILEEDGNEPDDFSGYKLQQVGEDSVMEFTEVFTEQAGLDTW